MDYEDFLYEEVENGCIETVNFSRATLKEANIFRTRIKKDTESGKRNIIVDLSLCDFYDSSFMGVLVVCTKNTFSDSGKLSIVVREGSGVSFLFKTTRLDRVLSIYQTKEDAIEHFIN